MSFEYRHQSSVPRPFEAHPPSEPTLRRKRRSADERREPMFTRRTADQEADSRSPACCSELDAPLAAPPGAGGRARPSRAARAGLFEQRPERRRLEQAPRARRPRARAPRRSRAPRGVHAASPALHCAAEPVAQLLEAARPRRRPGGRRAAARRRRSSGSPAAGTRRRSGRSRAEAVELAAHAERDRRAGVAAALPHAEAQVLAVADGRELGELAAVDEQRHAGVAEPERRERGRAPRRGRGPSFAPGTIASTARHAAAGRRRSAPRRRARRTPPRTSRRARAAIVRPGGGAMAAEALEVPGARARAPPCRSNAATERPEPFQSPSVPAISTTGRP